jgi:hypothetical protein
VEKWAHFPQTTSQPMAWHSLRGINLACWRTLFEKIFIGKMSQFPLKFVTTWQEKPVEWLTYSPVTLILCIRLRNWSSVSTTRSRGHFLTLIQNLSFLGPIYLQDFLYRPLSHESDLRPVFKTWTLTNKKLQSQKLAKINMSMWARLGRFLEIHGPKFWDFD